jgi:hypothetical protein
MTTTVPFMAFSMTKMAESLPNWAWHVSILQELSLLTLVDLI